MTDFISNLLTRHSDPGNTIKPRVRGKFEPEYHSLAMNSDNNSLFRDLSSETGETSSKEEPAIVRNPAVRTEPLRPSTSTADDDHARNGGQDKSSPFNLPSLKALTSEHDRTEGVKASHSVPVDDKTRMDEPEETASKAIPRNSLSGIKEAYLSGEASKIHEQSGLFDTKDKTVSGSNTLEVEKDIKQAAFVQATGEDRPKASLNVKVEDQSNFNQEERAPLYINHSNEGLPFNEARIKPNLSGRTLNEISSAESKQTFKTAAAMENNDEHRMENKIIQQLVKKEAVPIKPVPHSHKTINPAPRDPEPENVELQNKRDGLLRLQSKSTELHDLNNAYHQHQTSPGQPVIKVTIGRIDVRAVIQSAPPAIKSKAAPKPALTLEDYLKRNGHAK